MLALLESRSDLDRAVVLDHALDRNDRIRALGHDGARRDRHRLSGCERARRRTTRRDPLDHGQPPGSVAGADGEPVHRRAWKRRQVDRGRRVLREHAARRLGEGNRLRGKRPHAREDLAQRLLEREQGRHRDRILGP